MGHLKDFQQGTNGDPFNGPHNGTVGATTASTGAFTTLSATGATTLSAQLTASTGDGTYPIISKDTRAFSAGVTGPQLGFFGLDSTSTNNSLGAIRALAQTSQNGTLEARVLSSGAITTIGTFSSTGLAVTGLTDISAATSGQIKFPATQNASANVNTLDDYEEGTWTPSVGGNATYYTQTGNYTKIGNTVWVYGIMRINVIGTGSTSIISGLPFSAPNRGYGGSMEYFATISQNVIFLAPVIGGSSVLFIGTTAATPNVTDSIAIFQDGAYVIFGISYMVS
jgi:hypothetical protein